MSKHAKKTIAPKRATQADCQCGSGKPFLECHGAAQPPVLVPQLAAPSVTRKLDLACGQSPRDGFEGVDVWPNAKHVVNLFRFPWPFADDSVAELVCSHFIEHIPQIEVDAAGNAVPFGEGQDLFLKFFDECYRILVPGGNFEVIAPCGRSNRAWQDPTHRRAIVEPTFFYLSENWRKANKLDHYNVRCNFDGNVGWTVPTEMNALHQEVQTRKFLHEWNTIVDWVVKLKSMKQAPGLTDQQLARA